MSSRQTELLLDRTTMFLLVFAFVISISLSLSDALTCGQCMNISSPQSCNTFVGCNVGDRCFTTSSGVGAETTYILGCKTESECLGPSSVGLVGRDLATHCSQCCAVDNCNKKMCVAGTQVINEVGQCVDDPAYNCQKISGLFNICADVVHAKTACRKFCGLCDLVDGGWSLWAEWSNCDVTCGDGHMTRSRTCTDPAPAHGGLPCTGNTTEVVLCTLSPCPIHGGWSVWNSWSTCSHSCSIGTEARHRTCDNPTPQIGGNHCFGDAVDFRACFLRSCVDGGWSVWSSWSSCSRGDRTRTRVCNNPQPSTFGRDCSGNNKDWSKCGAVAFTVTHPNRTLIDGHPIFTNIITNVGGGYDPATGKFTCPIAGIYEFTFTVRSSGSHLVHCWISKNAKSIIFAMTSQDNSYDTSTASIYLELVVGDVVSLGSCNNWQYVVAGVTTHFSGILS